MSHKGINVGETRFIFLFYLLISIIISTPYIAGYVSTPSGYSFSGLVIDPYAYYSLYSDWLNQAKTGSLIFDTNITPENIPHLWLNTFYVLVGIFSRYTGFSNILSYYIFWYFFNLLFLISLYYFIAYIMPDIKKRKIAFLITMTSAGLGFISWVLFKILDFTPLFFSEKVPLSARIFPTDILLSDTIPFLIIFTARPHQIAALFLILLTYLYYLKGWTGNSAKYFLYAAISTFALGTFHLYDVISIYAVVTFFSVAMFFKEGYDSHKLKMYLAYILISIPPMIFNFYVFAVHPIYKEFSQFNFHVSPNPYSYIIGSGIPLILALYYFLKKSGDVKRIPAPILFLFSWVFVYFLLAYFPVPVQRRLVFGLHIPIAILAALSIYEHVLPKFKSRQTAVLLLLIVLMMPTNVLWVAKETYKITHFQNPPQFNNNLDLEAINWLGENTRSRDIVLSGDDVSRIIVGLISHKIYYSNADQNLYSKEKKINVEGFFNGFTDQQRIKFLKENDISYLYYGVEERSLGDFDPEGAEYLRNVFDNGRVKIYRAEPK